MRRALLIAVVLGVLTGCQMPPDEAKIQANDRWQTARSRLLYGVAQEHLKSGQLDLACTKAQEALRLKEDFLEAHLLLGKVYIEQGQYAQAIAELTQVAQKSPKLAEPHYLIGVAQEKSGRPEEALASYRRAQAMEENNLPAIMAATEVLVATDRIREAQIYVESYLSIAGEEPGMFELAGRLAAMRGEQDHAAYYYLRASDLDPKNVRYRELLAQAQAQAGRHREALETIDALLARKEHKPAAWLFTMRGDCCLALGRPQEARDAFYRVTEMQPEEAKSWTDLAKGAMACDDPARAIVAAKQALSLDGQSLEGILLLGYALLRDGQVSRAISVLTPAAAAHPAAGTLLCLLGRAHAAAGDRSQAMQCYGEALRADPSDELARTLLREEENRKLSKVD